MLWIANKLKIDLLKLTTAKALCANTVRPLMKDERSTKAIDVALSFGKGLSTRQELDDAAADATYAAYAAYAYAAAADATYAAYAAYAAAAADYVAYAAAAAADATYATYAAAAYATYATYAAAAAAKKENQLQTANICREMLTEEVFNALNLKIIK